MEAAFKGGDMMNDTDQDHVNNLSNLLGLYKAEWLSGKLFELFTEPGYFSELKTSRPCVLIGGRGTGKTTVLQGLSYQAQFAFAHGNKDVIDQWKFFGLYHRVNTNRVTAFRGPELSEDRWRAYFAHYVNLLFSSQLMEFASWYELQTGRTLAVSSAALDGFRVTLGLKSEGSLADLAHELRLLTLRFEASINSIVDAPTQSLSMQGAPVDALSQALLSAPELQGRQFFFLIDEFENFEDYQQRVLNTIIKHAPTAYTFKIGVRELGWRERATLNANEQLTSPADYARISIAERLDDARFKVFAEQVLTARFGSAGGGSTPTDLSVGELLPRLSESDEAELLIERGEAAKIKAKIEAAASPDTREAAASLPLTVQYFLCYWAESHADTNLPDDLRLWLEGSAAVKARFDNHFYASLFAIRRGKRGIRKYYCGWDVFLSLCEGNIRYLLELVHSALLMHVEAGRDASVPIDPETQTLAAQAVGRKNLSELEGLSVDGARLTRLLLSLGRVFGVLAASPAGHTPEANQFHLREDVSHDDTDQRANEVLKNAVMHLALVRYAGSKLLDERDTRAYDYMIHPIFAPFFVFSHRKKRKIQLSSVQLLDLVERPRAGIDAILKSNNRANEESLPDQLELFGEFYA
ncbi:ORC-CDC6 family AAA ATPase [Caballeronia sp. DA-9]|uniref:ORC-CDC6 family AAA ATPase n=1 Tax=Caballeronia sp. DA-9 TaxID=3436237 RepID=UPI003F66FAB0